MIQEETTNKPTIDPDLMEMAKKRVKFKKHLYTYLVTNTFFWFIWWWKKEDFYAGDGVPWPLYSMLGWGIGLFWHFIGTYRDDRSMIEREYNKLKKGKERN